MARPIVAFGVACPPQKATPLFTKAPQQLPAQQPVCSCHSYTSQHHPFQSKARARRPPIKCAAWGRKRSRPSDPSEDNNTKPSSEAPSSASENDSSQQLSPSKRQAAATSEMEDIGDLADKGSKAQPGAGKQRHARGAAWEDWEDWDPDWEGQPGDLGPPDLFRKNNPRRGMGSKTPRDEYLRPMIDTLGIQYRLGFKQLEAEERVQTEFETNQWESREAVKFSGLFASRLGLNSLAQACLLSIWWHVSKCGHVSQSPSAMNMPVLSFFTLWKLKLLLWPAVPILPI